MRAMVDRVGNFCSLADWSGSSANPSALLSSRLSAYLRRPCWTALSPCPLNKELIPVHPRKVFYYLTTSPRQETPIHPSDLLLPSPLINSLGSRGKGGQRVISPSLSNASIDEDAESAEDRKRAALSPSPEVDLSVPELDSDAQADDDYHIPLTPAGASFSGRSSLARDGTNGSSSEGINLVHNHRAASPPLEGDEKEFTQTASNMRMRGMSLDEFNIRESTETEVSRSQDLHDMEIDETEEEKARQNREAAAALFGGHEAGIDINLVSMSSAFGRASQGLGFLERNRREDTADVEMKTLVSPGVAPSWLSMGLDVRDPESVELEELDDLLGGY